MKGKGLTKPYISSTLNITIILLVGEEGLEGVTAKIKVMRFDSSFKSTPYFYTNYEELLNRLQHIILRTYNPVTI